MANAAAVAGETSVWKGNPSHIIYMKTYLLCGFFCWLVIPVFIAIWHYLKVRTTVYEITTDRLRVRHGVLNRTTENMELYRIKDFTVEQPFVYRMAGVGNVVLVTSDKTLPTLRIEAVKDPDGIVDRLRVRVESLRRELGIRELDR